MASWTVIDRWKGYDLLGHHLTALNMRLEAAVHLTANASHEQIEEAQRITRKLIADVREAVATLRTPESVDMGALLRPLSDDIPSPHVHISVPEGLRVGDPQRAHALVRCVQEITTNAARHARAQNLWIELVETPDGVEVRARDDGAGARVWQPGHGLTSMRERLEALGGGLSIESWPPPGFRVRAWLPLAARGA